MKHTEIKKIYNQYLKNKISENYILKGDMLYLKSNDNLLKGFVFGRSGYEMKGFYLHVFVQPLYLLDENINLTFGYRIKYNSNDFWEIDDKKDNTKLFIELEKAINKNSNDFLKIFDSSESFYKYYQNKCVNLRMVEAVVLSACYSLSEERFSLIDKYISILEKEDLSINWRKTLLEQARLLKQNISDEKVLKAILLEWQEETKRNLKL